MLKKPKGSVSPAIPPGSLDYGEMRSVNVSVVLPLYNKAPFIERSLRSIADQTYSEFEVIVVDDGSTDDGPALVERMIESTGDRRFRLVSQANAGPGAARNRGVREASAPILAFLDADDRWAPDYLNVGMNLLEREEGVDAVTSAYWIEPGHESSVPHWVAGGLTNGRFELGPDTPLQEFVSAVAFMCPWSTVMRAEAFHRRGGFYENRCVYGEDAYLFLRMLLNETVVFNLEPLVHYQTDASELAHGKVRKTPLEPFLSDPDPIIADCPAEHRELLRRFLAFRAQKRATILGYWGDVDEARAILQRFSGTRDWRMKYFLPATLARSGILTPVGAVVRRVLHR